MCCGREEQERRRAKQVSWKAEWMSMLIDLILCFWPSAILGRGAISSLNRRKLLTQADPKDLEQIF